MIAFVPLVVAPALAPATAPAPAPAPAPVLAPAPALAAGDRYDEPVPRFGRPIVHGLVLLTSMRAVEAYLWPNPFAETDLSVIGRHYADAYRLPPKFDPDRRFFEWDGDHWFINVVGHGLLGSELYLRGRTCGFGWGGALAWAASGSAIWEYGFEASGVRPSALDLVWTPLAGLGLGELRFQVLRASSGIRDRTARGIVRAVFDPFGEIDHALSGDACGRR
jgi:hypothetical protein